MTGRRASATVLAGVLALLPLTPATARAQLPSLPGTQGLQGTVPPGSLPGMPPGGLPGNTGVTLPTWPGLLGGTPPSNGQPIGPGVPGGVGPRRLPPPSSSPCPSVAVSRADIVFTVVLTEGGRQEGGRDFEFGAVQDLLIEVRWEKLPVSARQRLELYAPDGHLYQMFTRTLPADAAPVVTRVPVSGSWITSATLMGTWCAKVFLDDELEPAGTDDFELKLRGPALTGSRRRTDLLRLALRRTGRVRFRARGGSMRPSLRDGDVVSVASADAADVGIGDVVCYVPEPGRLSLHRVIGRDDGCLVTKGDALGWDERVPARSVLGKVTGVERPGRLASLGERIVRLSRRLRRPR